ncbi:ATP-binding protein [Rhodocaloribacter sp.]
MNEHRLADRLCVQKVQVRRLYNHDFQGLGLVDLVEGINIVYGPNGRGKTSLARSMQRLVWPTDATPERPTLEGTLLYRGNQWTIQFEAGAPRAWCDGQEASWVPPPDEHRDRYYLSLHDLLQVDDAPFAEAIMRDAVGGLDPEAAGRELDFGKASGRATKVTHEAQQALDALRQARHTQHELSDERNTLTSLKTRLKQARQAQAQLAVLEQVRTLRKARENLKEARLALAAFPEAMAKLRGDEAERLETLDPAPIQRRLAAAAEELKEATEAFAGIPLPADGLPPDLLTELHEHLDRLKDLDHERTRLDQEVARARAQADKAWGIIGGAIDAQKAAAIDLDDVRALGELLNETQKWRLQWETLRAELDRPSPEETEATAEETTLRQGLDYLRRWLRTPEPPAPPAPPTGHTLILLAALLAALLGMLGALLITPWAILLVLLGLLLGWVWYRQQPESRAQPADNPRASLQRFYLDTGLDAPAAWTDTAVTDLLQRLEKNLESTLDRLRKDRHRQEITEQFETLEARRADFVQKHRELADRIGIELQCTEQELFVILTRLERWADTCERLAGEEAAREEAERQYAACLEHINETLAALDFEPVGDHAGAAARIRHLETLADQQKDARSRKEQAEKDRAREQAALEKTTRDREAIFATLDLEAEDLKSLQDLIDRYEAYEESRKEVQDLETRVRLEKERLHTLDAFDEEYLSWDLPRVEEALAAWRIQVEEINTLQEQIAGIEARVRQAEEGQTLEMSRHLAEEHLDRLEVTFEADLRGALGAVLVEHLQDQARDQVLPNVFHQARELFRQITRGRYRLEMAASGRGFRAYDTVNERSFALEELSSGTRVQLLLAVRIAFVEYHEQGLKLPLLMDETLANSDEVKANAIIDAVIALSKNGRQVFYFTAREDEVAKWIRRAEQEEQVSCRIISLDENTTAEDLRSRALPTPFLDRDVPPPEGRSHEAYGALLNVPPWDGHQPLGALHLWYVIEDPEALYRLLHQGISRWGQLANLYPDPDAAPGLTDGAGARAVAYVHALEAWQNAWRIGRGRPVDKDALLASGAVSDTFMDPVHDLCKETGRDGKALIRALRYGAVKRFHSSKADALEAYLLEKGYIDDRQPLDEAALLARTRQAVQKDLARNVLTLEALDAFFRRLRRKVASPEIEA